MRINSQSNQTISGEEGGIDMLLDMLAVINLIQAVVFFVLIVGNILTVS